MKNLALGLTLMVVSLPAVAQVFTADVIVQGSQCVGLDCASSENFGFDTIRLKENNLRIHFDDSSAAGSFPDNDWRITINDSGNGGLNKFSIDDASANTSPFTIEAGAANNALYLNDEGDLGVGTSTPVVEAHLVDGNTPTLRLEQDGSSGFTPQTWDIAGNETNFFVRDVTNGSQLPFKIRPGAPNNALVIGPNGFVGMNAGINPSAPIHVRRTDAQQEFMRLESTAAGAQDRAMMLLQNNGGIRFQFDNNELATSWRFQAATGGDDEFQVTKVGTGDIEFKVLANGNAELLGVLTENSDRNAKTNIVEVDGESILARVSSLPISQWSYKDAADEHHIGPMAQDFRAAFGTGKSDTQLATLDTSGVALASIKALNEKLERENDVLRDDLAALKAQVELLQDLVQAKDPRVAAQ